MKPGNGNEAAGTQSAIGGGFYNETRGFNAVVPGGTNNAAAGDNSFAAGRLAHADHDGSFVWADSSGAPFASQHDNQFRVRATGGVRFDVNGDHWVSIYRYSRIGGGVVYLLTTSSGAYLTESGIWTDNSDRDAKENFRDVDGREVLARVARLPITSWNFKAENPSVRHMGPVAQDFHATFGVGADDRHLAALDTGGVALAAIQGLHALVREKDTELAAQKREITELKARLARLEKLVADGAQRRAE